MATGSFYEDMVVDTPEAVANLIAFAEEEPHLVVNGKTGFEDADDEFIKDLIEDIRSKNGWMCSRTVRSYLTL